MTAPKNGGPASPVHPGMDNPELQGKTLRDWFVGQASDSAVAYFQQQYIQVIRTNEPESWKEPLVYGEFHCRRLAEIEVRYRMAFADAMLNAREKGDTQ